MYVHLHSQNSNNLINTRRLFSKEHTRWIGFENVLVYLNCLMNDFPWNFIK